MRETKEKLIDIYLEIMPAIWLERLKGIQSQLETEGKAEQQVFLNGLKKLLKEWERNNQEEKEPLSYVLISFLGSSVITRSYEMQIAFFDRMIYAEENPLCFYWTPKFFWEHIETDMGQFREEARKRMIGLQEDEVEELRRRYVVCHEYLILLYLSDIMKEAKELPEWAPYLGRKIEVLCGTYMESMIELCVIGDTKTDPDRSAG